MILRQKWESAERGFTLIELLLVASLSGILFGIIFQLIHVSEIGFNRGWHKSDFYRSAQRALLLISSEARGANELAVINPETLQLTTNKETIRYKIQTDSESQWIVRQLYQPVQKEWINDPTEPIAAVQMNSSIGNLQFILTRIASGYYQITLKNNTDQLFVSCFLRK